MINDGTTESERGFPGTIPGLVQESVEEVSGARSVTKIKGEKNETAQVVFADAFEEKAISATILASLTATFRKGTIVAYGTGTPVNMCVTDARRSKTAKFHRIQLKLRKEASMTYALPA
jgi:hypothetical protein